MLFFLLLLPFLFFPAFPSRSRDQGGNKRLPSGAIDCRPCRVVRGNSVGGFGLSSRTPSRPASRRHVWGHSQHVPKPPDLSVRRNRVRPCWGNCRSASFPVTARRNLISPARIRSCASLSRCPSAVTGSYIVRYKLCINVCIYMYNMCGDHQWIATWKSPTECIARCRCENVQIVKIINLEIHRNYPWHLAEIYTFQVKCIYTE